MLKQKFDPSDLQSFVASLRERELDAQMERLTRVRAK
jgi:hypothetical protein